MKKGRDFFVSLGGSDFLSYLCPREWVIVHEGTSLVEEGFARQKKRYAPNLLDEILGNFQKQG